MRKKKSSKSQSPTSSMISLSPHLVEEVLCRLPVKSLLKFRCVCKEWRSLIDNPDFASLHLTRYNALNHRLFVVENSHVKKRPKCLTRRNGTLTETSHLAMPKNWVSTLRFGYYANGLMLFSRYDPKIGFLGGFVSWNPSTRTCLEIPSHGNLYGKRDILTVLVEPPTKGVNDYKLFVIALDFFYGRNRRSVIEVYCFNTGSWRSCSIHTKCVENLQYGRDCRTTVSLNGVVHWIGRNPKDNSKCIVAFDVHSYVVSYFGLPLVGCHGFRELSVLNGTLAVVFQSKGEYEYHDVWVMENYGADDSWVNRFEIDHMFLNPLRNGKFIGIIEAQISHKVYDIGRREVLDLTRICNRSILFVDSFVETLVLPSGGVDQLKN